VWEICKAVEPSAHGIESAQNLETVIFKIEAGMTK
jgi:hypothetical protein